MRFALIILALVAAAASVGTQPASAQAATAPPASAALSAASASGSGSTPTSTPTPTAQGVALPATVVVELKGSSPAEKSSAGGAVTVAVASGLLGLAVAMYNGWRMGSTERMKADAARETAQMQVQAAANLQTVRQAFEAAQSEIERIAAEGKERMARAYDQEMQTAARVYEQRRDEANRLLASGQHEDKIALEMQALKLRADVSDLEAYMAVKRLDHERDVAQANLVHTFFDRLLGESQRERDLALFAISAFVDPARLAQLAAGGESIVSRESLSRLAARGADDVAAAAQRVLNDDGAAVRGSVVRVYLKGGAQPAANGFVCDGNLVVTYLVVGQGGVFDVQQAADGERLEATCVAVDEAHFLAVGWVRTGLGGAPLPLREALVRAHDTHVRLVQWSDGQFIVRAGIVVATDAQERVQGASHQVREVKQAVNVRVLAEPGSAGAPVLDEEGRVAGMIFGGQPGRENSLAAPASAIKAVLAQARAAVAALPPPPAADKSGQTTG